MSFYAQMPYQQRETYEQYLKLIGSLSRLFSDASTPYIPYRVAENIFCMAFDAENLARADVAADAKKHQTGVGIKTFLQKNNASWQKIAEFNRDFEAYRHLPDAEKIRAVARLRNNRLAFVQRTHKIEHLVYHCVLRRDETIALFEEPIHFINVHAIRQIHKRDASIEFDDGLHQYKFYPAKSTLYKQFVTRATLTEFHAPILANPLDALRDCLSQTDGDTLSDETYIILPLYAPSLNEVPEKSGLNQWNASGRERHPDEVYIPIPIWIHRVFEGFFPPRDEPFTLALPGGESLSVKVCQDNSKALMSNPNKALGEWLLRDVLQLQPGQLLTRQWLDDIGVDAVRISKHTHQEGADYRIDFCATGTYTDFEDDYNT